jgi:D-3-phosphoglycerate dehydrogenase
MIDARALAVMRPAACLVNTARGPLVRAASLLDALADGRLSAAALDVFEEEPLPPDSPLRRHERVVLTDHTAWYSEESQVELQRTAAEEIARVCTGGLPRSLANPVVLDRLGRRHEWDPPEHMRWQLKRLENARRATHDA